MTHPQKSPGARQRFEASNHITHTHGSPADRLLPLLRNVRKYGAGWRADCPNGHDKAHGSLWITEADGGRLRMTCFACHDTPAILATLDLELADLFPERIRDPSPEARQRAREAFKCSVWSAALGVLGREATVVTIAAHDLAAGNALSPEDHARLLLAEARIQSAREVLTP